MLLMIMCLIATMSTLILLASLRFPLLIFFGALDWNGLRFWPANRRCPVYYGTAMNTCTGSA